MSEEMLTVSEARWLVILALSAAYGIDGTRESYPQACVFRVKDIANAVFEIEAGEVEAAAAEDADDGVAFSRMAAIVDAKLETRRRAWAPIPRDWIPRLLQDPPARTGDGGAG